MKKALTLFSAIALLIFTVTVQGQDLIAKWTFPTGNATDSLADGGLPVNLTMGIHTEGGTAAIDFTKNGATTKSAQATGWDNGAMSKCWVIQINTVGYDHLKLSSKQQSGGNNPGPRDYMVQYRLGTMGTWADVPNTTILTANDWSTGILDNIELPEACNDQPSVYLRWIMTTNTNSSGGTVASGGINKIDDIYITGLVVISIDENEKPLAITVAPNPSRGEVTVISPSNLAAVELLDMQGRIIYSVKGVNNSKVTMNASFAPKGSYVVRVTSETGMIGVSQLVLY
jgi:hypothetical protein